MISVSLLPRAIVCAAAIGSLGVRAFECSSDVQLGPVAGASKKGIVLDDDTLRLCPAQVPQAWPNAQEKVASIRSLRAWDPAWDEEGRRAAWRSLAEHAARTGAKVLLGSPITCDEQADDTAWGWTMALAELIGPSGVMGVVIGDDLDLLGSQGAQGACTEDLWERGRLWRKFRQYVAEFDAGGFAAKPVSSAFSDSALAGDDARVGTFLANATAMYGARYAFTANVRPHFISLGSSESETGDCSVILDAAGCWHTGCSMPARLLAVRERMEALTGSRDSLLWVGATGWPERPALPFGKSCPARSSEELLERFYRGFLGWDMDLGSGVKAPDHAFWSSMRDPLGEPRLRDDHLGLIAGCNAPRCKIASAGFRPYIFELHLGPKRVACGDVALFNGWAWGGLETCQSKCEIDERCRFFGSWPHSHENLHWCRLTSTCDAVEPEYFEVSTFQKWPATVTAAGLATSRSSTAALPESSPSARYTADVTRAYSSSSVEVQKENNASATIESDLTWLRETLDNETMRDSRSRPAAGPLAGLSALLTGLWAMCSHC